MSDQRIDTASLLIKATPVKIYRALTEQSAIREWKAPTGMQMEIFHYNVNEGGTYRVALRYDDKKAKGKAGDNSDVVNGRFLELVPGKKIVEAIRFDSPDPAFSGEMIMTTELTPEKGGTLVTFTAEQVPEGITHEDHIKGMESSLGHLGHYMAARA
jgi:uncharacterized protein YndB with AHSA1/START domain